MSEEHRVTLRQGSKRLGDDFMTTQTRYIVLEHRKNQKSRNRTYAQTWYVAARPGYMRCTDGTFARDGSFAGGPEWTLNRDHALEFKSHRAAALVRSKCPSAIIEVV